MSVFFRCKTDNKLSNDLYDDILFYIFDYKILPVVFLIWFKNTYFLDLVAFYKFAIVS